jgi:small subunit ribosomal protein S17
MRGKRKTFVGVVISDKMNKTRTVHVERFVQHPRVKKYIKKYTKCYVHDEFNQSKVGDTVEIMETRPLSKLKRWRLVRIIKSETQEQP